MRKWLGTLTVLYTACCLACGGASDNNGSQDSSSVGSSSSSLPQKEFSINFHHGTWGSANLHYNLSGSGWTTVPGAAMSDQGNGWWRKTTAAGSDLEFVFNEGGSDWFPGGSGNNYRTSLSNTWISNGLVYSHDPGQARPANELVLLSLNLHTYQETGAIAKLETIADVIAEVNPDFVFLQECAQHKDDSLVSDPRAPYNQSGQDQIKATNMARVIADRLFNTHSKTYSYYWSWAHYGWTVWEEGVAVMTRHTISGYGNKYISTSTSTGDMHARKAVFVSATVSGIGLLNVFSAHTSWWDFGLSAQIDSLKSWVTEKESLSPVASIICGDFNADAGSEGYNRLVSTTGGRFVDCYYVANPRGFSDATISGGGRIDYVFYKDGNPVTPQTVQIYFKDVSTLGGLVSDHYGLIARLRVD